MQTPLLAENITKVYPGGTVALKNVSLSVNGGEITTLLGKNGAGKTTFVRIAATLLKPTSGRIRVFGYDAVAEPYKVRERIALMPQESYPLTFPRPGELIEAYLVMHGWSISDARLRTRRILEETGLWVHRNKSISQLSGGMKRKVLLAMVLASGAELLFLDEPTLGLDPHARRSVWELLERTKKEGCTIVLTTHYMDEAEMLSDKIVVIDNGEVLVSGTVDEMLGIVGSEYKLEVEGLPPRELLPSGGRFYRHGSKTIVYGSREELGGAVPALIEKGFKVRISSVRLEDAFLLVTKSLEELRWS